jgi:hypothetical protein
MKEMTVWKLLKLEKVLPVWLVRKHVSRILKMKLYQLASGQSVSVTRVAEKGFKGK